MPWHKWTGIAVFFLAAIGYWCRTMPWYQAPVAKGLALVTTLCVVLAGHYGAVFDKNKGGEIWLRKYLSQKAKQLFRLRQVLVNVLLIKADSSSNPTYKSRYAIGNRDFE